MDNVEWLTRSAMVNDCDDKGTPQDNIGFVRQGSDCHGALWNLMFFALNKGHVLFWFPVLGVMLVTQKPCALIYTQRFHLPLQENGNFKFIGGCRHRFVRASPHRLT